MLTKDVYLTHLKNTKKPISFQSKEVGFFCSIAVRIFADASQRSRVVCSEQKDSCKKEKLSVFLYPIS